MNYFVCNHQAFANSLLEPINLQTTKLVKTETSINNLKFIWYVGICCSIGLQFFIRPLVAEPEIIQIGNITEVGPRDLIILTWFPFDEQKYYWVNLLQTNSLNL